jgi:hypothetical protein
MEGFVGVPCVHGLFLRSSSADRALRSVYWGVTGALGCRRAPQRCPLPRVPGGRSRVRTTGRQAPRRRLADVRDQPPPHALRRSRAVRGPDRAGDRRAPRGGSSVRPAGDRPRRAARQPDLRHPVLACDAAAWWQARTVTVSAMPPRAPAATAVQSPATDLAPVRRRRMTRSSGRLPLPPRGGVA